MMTKIEKFLTEKMSANERRQLAESINPPQHLRDDWEKVKRLYTDKRFDSPLEGNEAFTAQLDAVEPSVKRLLGI